MPEALIARAEVHVDTINAININIVPIQEKDSLHQPATTAKRNVTTIADLEHWCTNVIEKTVQ